MARTTVAEVRDIFDTNLSDSSLSAWLDIASDKVDDVDASSTSISQTRLEHLEKLLTAHYASSQDQRIDSTSAETKSMNYQGNTGMGLKGTKYGQQAIELDPTGVLLDATKQKATLDVPNAKDLEYNH